ncbi:MAG: radical SAM protein [bacterium]|nr:B12-binding domain-containing radical SAM protein [bacterium]MBU1917447.1 B12-binding domain-containing radical SAM protein [bacterium]
MSCHNHCFQENKGRALLDFKNIISINNAPGPILLIFPPFHRLMGEKTQWIPLGLSSLAACMTALGCETIIYNADNTPFISKNNEYRLSCSERYRNASQYQKMIQHTDHPIWKEIEKTISEVKPWLVGITVHSENVASANRVLSLVKKYSHDTVTVCGGPHITLAETKNMKNELINYIVKGEGESAFAKLVNDLSLNKATNKVYFEKQSLDLETLPLPNTKHVYKSEDYPFLFKKRMIACSRGCPGQCGFCSAPQLWGRKMRFRSVGHVMLELKEAINAGADKIFFCDDTFVFNRKYSQEICQAIKDSNLKFAWTCTTRANGLKSELLNQMKEVGCKSVHLGVETGSKRILKMIKKKVSLEDVRKAVKLIKEAGIDVSVFMMMGFPTETDEEVQASMNLVKELDAEETLLHPLIPIIGTSVYDEARESGLLEEDINWNKFSRDKLFYSFYKDMAPAKVDHALNSFFELSEKV